jgi:hypothetical protein
MEDLSPGQRDSNLGSSVCKPTELSQHQTAAGYVIWNKIYGMEQ